MNTITHPFSPSHGKNERDYAQNPLLVYWETTRACALACRHCRAEAMPCADPKQLTHLESVGLLYQILAFGDPLPHLILTGGDPLERPDLYDLIDDARALGIGVSITPSATHRLTPNALLRLKEHGIESIGLSLDGSNAARHDGIRNVPGCFDATVQAAKAASVLDLPVQINTLVAEETADDLPAIYDVVKELNIMRWSLFFLIAVGRGKTLNEVAPEHAERLMEWVYDLSQVAPFAIKTTEAPSYRRVALNQMRKEQVPSRSSQNLRRGFGIRDGNGIVFVSNTGDVYPAGFLPLSAGNIRTTQLANIYRDSELFQKLRRPDQFTGKCGVCEYRVICGGSRARAFAHTGDALSSDPLCVYEPKVVPHFRVVAEEPESACTKTHHGECCDGCTKIMALQPS
ncbi:MAG TPA: TIGR04053 family radical SAM/SPASM domain-containing protein [Terriglobales bacterium]